MSEFINTIDALGDDVVIDSIINKTITEFKDDKVTSVGQYAFYGCTQLSDVDLPNATGIGTSTFENCTALSSIDIPEVTTINKQGCSGCKSLTNVNLPKVTSLSNNAFSGCSELKSIDLPKVTSLGNNAFSSCAKLESLILPSLTSSIGGFHSCSAMRVIDLPILTAMSGSSTFYGCKSLRAVILRSGTMCTLSDTNHFNGGTPIANGTGYIYVPGSLVDSYKSATNWSTYANQFRGIINDEEALHGIIDETLVDYSSSQLQVIPNYAFNKYTPLKSVSLPNVETVLPFAFDACTGLVSIDLPKVTSIQNYAFRGCSSLREVTFNSPVGLGYGAFRGCTGLEKVDLTFKQSAAIPGEVFKECSSLRALVLRNTTMTVLQMSNAMSGTGFIYVPGTLVASYKSATNWSTYATQFRGILDDEEALQGIIDETLIDYSNSQLQAIPDGAFYNYTPLKSISLPNVTTIGGEAFSKCTALTDVNCPAITTIDEGYLFNGCTSLKNVNLPALTSIGYDARNLFAECKTLETISLPNLVTAGRFMFYNCSVLKNASVPKLTSVPRACFQSCGLLTIDLPLVTNIDAMGFYQNINLAALILRSETMCTLASTNAFDNCCHIVGSTLYGANPNKLKDGYIYVPRALVDSYKSATNWSTYASQFRALEDYTVDGTLTGEFDPYKPYRDSDIVSNGLVFNLELRGRTAENNPSNPPVIKDTVGGLACTTYNIDWDGVNSGFVENGLLLKNCNLIASKNIYSEPTYSVLATPKLPDVDFSNGLTWECWTNTDGGPLCRFFGGTSNGTTLYQNVLPGGFAYAQKFVDSDGTINDGAYYDFALPSYASTNVKTGDHLFSYTYSPDGILSHYVDGKFVGSTDYNSKGTFGHFCLPDVVKTMTANYIGSMSDNEIARQMVVSEYRMYNRVLSADDVMNNYAVTKISLNGG